MSKKIIGLVTLSLITSTLLHATNGDNLIGLGAKSRAMGGTGIATYNGAESALSNPSLITSIKGSEVSFGGTLFLPDVSTQLGQAPEYTSDAKVNTIPEVSIAHQLSDSWYVGIGIWGTAGMGVDYSKAPVGHNFNMVTNLQLLQFGVPIAYKYGGLSVGVTVILQYGNLDINYHMPTPPDDNNPQGGLLNVGAGIAQDYGVGYTTGISYDFSELGINGLLIGATRKAELEMNFDGQFKTATTPFKFPGFPDLYSGNPLVQPEEYGAGLSYTYAGNTLAFDYKQIKWSTAGGYQEFGWEDQNVYAVGYQFKTESFAFRLGYNYGSSAVVEGTDPRLNLFNLLGFPATEETHYTAGGSYNLTDKISVDLAFVYAPEVSKTFDISALNMGINDINTKHAENSYSFQLNYLF